MSRLTLLISAAAPLVLLAGCSGSPATTTAATSSSATASAAATSASASASASASVTTASLTMAEVAQHADATSCWTVVDGKVYDLTKWIPNHPGGPDKIKALCGKDGTAAFSQQHGTAQKQNDTLATFLLGPLA